MLPLNAWAQPRAAPGRVSFGKGPTVLVALPRHSLEVFVFGGFAKPHYKNKLLFKTSETKTVKEREILPKFVQGL